MKKYLFLVLCFTVSHFFVEAQNSAQADSCWKQLNADMTNCFESNFPDEFIPNKQSIKIQMTIELDATGKMVNFQFLKYEGIKITEYMTIKLAPVLFAKNYACLIDPSVKKTKKNKQGLLYEYEYIPLNIANNN